ncbi:fatty acid--CoA ligase [Nitratiruptor sp. SB155-2]|uniref:fatty acid--CoA ligase n=1 Tax=Nitratiruptor sp. (strain SB155-2) TaxID=387092 RepID=UPI0001586D1E|nr:fatty acid--CoA ligase [Nitratiruptor sp. SB155-2]BAF69649.1 long-chain fatty-acid-CoA ligase [Nitratiruptor sp. SB155-2]
MFDYRYNNFYEIVKEHATKRPKSVAYFIDERKITFHRLLLKIDTLARFMELMGVQKEEKVAIIMANSLEFIITLLAAQKLGAIPVPINNFLKEDEITFILNDSDAKLLAASAKYAKELRNVLETTNVQKIVWEGEYQGLDENNIAFSEILESLESHEKLNQHVDIDDTAVIIYTSGTTGKPKGAMLSYRNIFSNILGVERLLTITPKDRFIVYLPMFHSFTLTVTVLMPLYFGSPVVIIRSIMPFSNIIKQLLLKRVTIFTGVPDVYNALSKAKLPWYFHWFNKVKYYVSGAAALPEDTLKRFQSKFKKGKLLEGYGLSECSPVVAVNLPNKQKPKSVGPALPGVEVKIVDEDMVELSRGEVGEIIVKGDNVMQGYWKRPEATAETIVNGWLKTGDLGYMDDEGFIYIVDRKKDLIISKGINIYPREIEEVLMNNPHIKAAAVIGIKDEKSGEVPVAYVELEDGEKISENEIKRYLKEHLANFKVPRSVYIVDELPKNATGKVLKRVLKERLQKEKE